MGGKKGIIFICGMILGSVSLGECAPCYGLNLPYKNKFFLGTQYHQVIERKLEKNLGELKSKQGFLLLSYGIFDWFSLDLKAGLGDINKKPENGRTADYEASFAGGYGFRIRFFEKENKALVFGFQHISVHPESIHINSDKHSAILDDWQVSLLGGLKLKRISPYLGMRWSRQDYIHKRNKERKRIMSDLTKSLGIIFGFDFFLKEKFWLNFEGNFLDGKETAVSLNFSF
ncbi:MAG: hypothetical protein N2Z79_00685 [Candidatus Omnitrophica bacterium]|nr:hypothetical protein [Candidatus Omnitrophota bacterium]